MRLKNWSACLWLCLLAACTTVERPETAPDAVTGEQPDCEIYDSADDPAAVGLVFRACHPKGWEKTRRVGRMTVFYRPGAEDETIGFLVFPKGVDNPWKLVNDDAIAQANATAPPGYTVRRRMAGGQLALDKQELTPAVNGQSGEGVREVDVFIDGKVLKLFCMVNVSAEAGGEQLPVLEARLKRICDNWIEKLELGV